MLDCNCLLLWSILADEEAATLSLRKFLVKPVYLSQFAALVGEHCSFLLIKLLFARILISYEFSDVVRLSLLACLAL